MDRRLNGWHLFTSWAVRHPWLTGLALGVVAASLLHFAFGSRWGYVLPLSLCYPFGVGFWRWLRGGSLATEPTARAVDRARSATERQMTEAKVPTRFGV